MTTTTDPPSEPRAPDASTADITRFAAEIAPAVREAIAAETR